MEKGPRSLQKMPLRGKGKERDLEPVFHTDGGREEGLFESGTKDRKRFACSLRTEPSDRETPSRGGKGKSLSLLRRKRRRDIGDFIERSCTGMATI